MHKRKLPLEVKMDLSYTRTLIESPSKQIKFGPQKSEFHETTSERVDFSESIGGTSCRHFKSPQKCTDVEFLLNGIDFDESISQSVSREDFLVLTEWRRCMVETIERDENGYDLILYGREEEDSNEETENEAPKKKFKCYLQDAWSNCKVKQNCLISLVAEWNNVKNSYCISNKSGFLIIYPDQLISGTTVVGSLFCMRKAILSDRFKGIYSNNKIVSIIYIHFLSLDFANETDFRFRFLL